MKVLCRGDILTLLGNPVLPCPPAPFDDVSSRAREIQSLVEAGEMRYAEPFLALVIDRVALIGTNGADRRPVRAIFEDIRQDLKRPRRFSLTQWPYRTQAESTIVVPQHNRAYVHGVAQAGADRIYLLVKDYKELLEESEDLRLPRRKMFWRLFMYTVSSQRLVPVVIPEASEAGEEVAICGTNGGLFMICRRSIYCYRPDGVLVSLGTLELPNYDDGEPVLQSFVIANGELVVVARDGAEDCTLTVHDLAGRLGAELGYAGNMVEALTFSSRSQRVYLSNLLELRAFNLGGVDQGGRDFKLYFDEFPYYGRTILCEAHDGALHVCNGSKILTVSGDLSQVLGETVLPTPVIAIFADAGGQLITVSRDPLTNVVTYRLLSSTR